MLKPGEEKLVLWSFLYFFCLLSGYFLLRPLRDEMGIVNGAENMQWLFTGTFVCMLVMVPVFGYVTKQIPLKKVMFVSYMFFISHLFLFYLVFVHYGKSNTLAIIFFIWLSVFNLFVVSLFWSFMADVFSSESSKRTFGLISAGGSLGAITGPLASQFIARHFSIPALLLVAIIFLSFTLVFIHKIAEKKSGEGVGNTINTFNGALILNKNFWKSLMTSLKSRYILGIVMFIVLYTSVSTILYFKQAHIIENTILVSNERVQYFSRVDLITNSLTILGQFFITNRMIRKYGLSIALASIPVLLAVGFLVVSYKLSLVAIAILMIIHRAGNFSILRPSREILFTVCTKEEKYRVKNFIDTVVYRGGDALMGWVFTLWLTLGFGLSAIALFAIPLVLFWALVGFKLGKEQLVKERKLKLNKNERERIYPKGNG